MKNFKMKIQKRKTKRGQTALEYALVTVGVSLVMMAAWNTVGSKVKGLIEGSMLNKITQSMEKGNFTVTGGR